MSVPAISQRFGSSGLKTYNLINEALSQVDGQLKGEYDQENRRITILHSSRLSPLYLHEILYGSSFANQYCGWYPDVKESRTEEKDLIVGFSPKPSFPFL